MEAQNDLRGWFARNWPEGLATAARLAALVGVFLPWVLLDDASRASNGPELAAYFWDGADRDFLRSTDLVKFLGFCAAPWVVSAAVLIAALKPMVTKDQSLFAHVTSIAAILVFSYCGTGAVDDWHAEFFGLLVPMVGLWIVTLGTAVSMTIAGTRGQFTQRQRWSR
ncbi:MAG: hypothetical protein F4Y63_09930 [Chloroflexi bacterium]|nr:hypothetical protein [Chloroflexota bacterium]MYK62137.1 hypothetical protein [Chloroflexota bacterium]